MRTWSFALLGLVLVTELVTAADPPPKLDFQQFASSAGKYKVLFPGAVKTETSEVKTPTGTRTLTLDSVALNESTLFVVTYIDVPEDVAKTPPNPRLDKIREAIKGPEGKLLGERGLEIGPDKLPAREILIEKGSVVLRNRIILNGTRMYQVMIQGPREFVSSGSADQFLDSFEVTK